MAKKLYVGNLSFSINDDSLNDHFAKFGEVASAKVILDRETNRSRGFGFVEMSNDEDADKAISELDGSDFEGRNIRVNEAKEQQPRRGGGGRNFNR